MAGQSEQLLVMTYNVLAQCYVRSSFFPYCTPAALRWKNRSKKLVIRNQMDSACIGPRVSSAEGILCVRQKCLSIFQFVRT